MALPASQISAYVSEETKELLDRYSETSGVKKGHVIEMALLHHLQALCEIPQDLIIPPRMVVSRETGEWLMDLVEHPPEPTEAMKALFAGEGEERG